MRDALAHISLLNHPVPHPEYHSIVYSHFAYILTMHQRYSYKCCFTGIGPMLQTEDLEMCRHSLLFEQSFATGVIILGVGQLYMTYDVLGL